MRNKRMMNLNFFQNIVKARYILLSLVKQDLKNKYRNSLIGVGWSLLTPLGLVLIIGTVFSKVLGQPMRDFIPFLFSGLIPWLYLVQCAEGGTIAFISAEGYIKQTQTPIEIFPVRVCLVAFVNLIYSLIAYFIIYLFIEPDKFNFNMLFLIASLIIWIILGISLSTLSGIINTYIRDFAPLQSLALQGLFYATPIMYPANILKKSHFEWIYKWNPFYYLIEIIRKPMLGEPINAMNVWGIAICFVVFLFVLSILTLSKVGRNITFRL
jgi:ABC-type polysaccharide/polyol phosphate export permease